MAEQFQNFFVTKLREACDAVATTIYVDTVPAITEGTLVLEYANSTKHEIIHFTGVSGYGLTGCTRGLEGTTAQSHSAGTDVRQNLTAGMIDKIINGVITTENIANSAVTTAKINNGAVTADKIDFTTLSEQEQIVGKWVDGNILYRGVYNFGAIPKQTVKKIPHNITNLNRVIDFFGTAKSPAGVWIKFPWVSVNAVSDNIELQIEPTEISLRTGANWPGDLTLCYIIMYYTKTS